MARKKEGKKIEMSQQQQSPTVLVYSEIPEVTLELITLSRNLGAGNISVAVIGFDDTQDQVAKLSVNSVSNIYKVSSESLKDLASDGVVDALEAVHRQSKPNLILIGATRRGKEIASRLATRLNIGCITDAMKLELAEGVWKADRLVWGGNAIATVSSKGAFVVTIPLRANEIATGSSQPSVIDVKVEPRETKVKLIGRKERPKGTANIKDANVVISAGRGFKKKEDLILLDGLASTLNGVVGASRPLTSDLGWMPEDRQVGLSGTTVKPKLYIAVGISGQIQHLTGMRESKVVVAINTDKNAPIFQESDYGVVGDLYAVVPELEKALKQKLGR